MYKVLFREDRCKGCKLCETSCPKGIISMSDNTNIIGYNFANITADNQKKCIGCGFCFRMCPDSVITIINDGV
nr:4Fe-4S binding protein [Candidatus Arthromitus sp. SFB-rat-Yit]